MGHKILLADDSITIQKVIELTFSDEDFELHTVGNGQKAIDEIRSIMPHIVLCDIIMPEKNGYEVCEFIKSSSDLKHVPVLLLTGAFEPFDQERARAAGCDGFLAKPFEPQTLISKVKELLARTPARAAAPPPPAAKPVPAPPPPSAFADERTVIMPPSPPRVAPAPPPLAPVEEYGSGFDNAFAIEAGERELMMEPGDHTVLLGGQTAKSSGEAAPAGDDIWGAVGTPLASEEEDSSTVFMAPPPVGAMPVEPPAAPTQAFGSPSYEVQYEADDLDATWRMPNEGESETTSSYQGFEEFTEPPQEIPTFAPPPIPAPPPVAAAPPLEMPPPLAPAAPEPVSTFEPYDPFMAAAAQSPPGFDPVSPYETDQTLDAAVSSAESFERISSGGFDAYGEPPIVAANELPGAEPEPVFEASASGEPFDEIDALGPSEIPEPPPVSAGASFGGDDGAPVSIDDALIDKIAARVVDKLSQRIVQEIAWEVVPDLAEGMIQREIDALKAKLAKVSK